MRRISALLLTAALVTSIAACTPTPGGAEDPAPTGRPALTFEVDAPAASTVTVRPAEGGTVFARAGDGTTFQLTIPPHAVLEPVDVTLTPLTDVAGGIGESPVAVRLEPDGLELLAPAVLRIDGAPDSGLPLDFWFSAAHDGTDPVPVVVTPEGDLAIHHFSMAGYSGVNDTAFDAAFGVAAGDLANQLEQQVARVTQEAKNGTATIEDVARTIDEATQRMEDEVLRPYVEQLSSGPQRCSSQRTAISAVLGNERNRELWGMTSNSPSIVTILEVGFRDCERERIQECKRKADPSVLVQFWIEHARELTLIGASDGSVDIAAMETRARERCLPPAYTASGGGNGMEASGTVTDVRAAFTLQGSGDGFTITMLYRPGADWRSGTMTYEGAGSGVVLSGSGTYTISGEDGEVLTLTQTGGGCTDSECADGTEIITLTPVPRT